MDTLRLDTVAVDCGNEAELAGFYAAFLDLPLIDGGLQLRNGEIMLWFQQVEGYLPPTWPSQERGQQVHLDFAVADIDAWIERAMALGATLSERREGYHYPVLLDPAGHPFCLIHDDTAARPAMTTINYDADDHLALAAFYQQLLGGEINRFDAWSNLIRDGEVTLSFQHADGYQPPTWPTQERGQQIHIDVHTSDHHGHTDRAEALGATLLSPQQGFNVMADPARHTFCICDPVLCTLGK